MCIGKLGEYRDHLNEKYFDKTLHFRKSTALTKRFAAPLCGKFQTVLRNIEFHTICIVWSNIISQTNKKKYVTYNRFQSRDLRNDNITSFFIKIIKTSTSFLLQFIKTRFNNCLNHLKDKTEINEFVTFFVFLTLFILRNQQHKKAICYHFLKERGATHVVLLSKKPTEIHSSRFFVSLCWTTPEPQSQLMWWY